MPVFLTMTQSLDDKARAKIAKKATVVAFIILVLFPVNSYLNSLEYRQMVLEL